MSNGLPSTTPKKGFCVLRIKARGHRELITVIGHAAVIAAGEWVTASGEWVNDRTARHRGHCLRQCRAIVGGVGGRVSAYLRPSLARSVRTLFSVGLRARPLSLGVIVPATRKPPRRSRVGQVRNGLCAGGRWIRTSGSAPTATSLSDRGVKPQATASRLPLLRDPPSGRP